MKKFTAVITDADIRYYIDQAATELEEDDQIRFPDSNARADFIEDRQMGNIGDMCFRHDIILSS